MSEALSIILASRAEQNYVKLLVRFPRSVNIMRQYASFLTHVKNDAQMAQMYLNMAEEIENTEMRERQTGFPNIDGHNSMSDFGSGNGFVPDVSEKKNSGDSLNPDALNIRSSVSGGLNQSKSGSKQVVIFEDTEAGQEKKSKLTPKEIQKNQKIIDSWRQTINPETKAPAVVINDGNSEGSGELKSNLKKSKEQISPYANDGKFGSSSTLSDDNRYVFYKGHHCLLHVLSLN